MTKLLMRLASIPALVLVLWSCGDLAEPSRLTGPGDLSRSSGTTTGTPLFRPIKGVYSNGSRSDSKIVQPTAGGSIGVAGTVIDVPAGAVSQLTLFTMELAPVEVDGKTKVQVALRAYQKDASGNYTVDVGAAGFLKPLKFRMSYDWATDPILDPKLLQIVWMKEDGTQEVYVSQLDASGRTLSTQLNHFSDYAIGFPDAT